MATTINSIRPLPPELQAQIRSSVVITSLNDVVIGLLENVLDARATSAEIHLDYVKGYCSVTDNGSGIPAEEFTQEGHLGSLHCTSKADSTSPTYGRYGRFLYHLAALSLINISSTNGEAESSLTLHRAKVIASSTNRTDPNVTIPNKQGCQVVVGNLFGDIPVRFKHVAGRLENKIAAEAEFASLKNSIVALLLVCASKIEVNVIEIRTKQAFKIKDTFLDKYQTKAPVRQRRLSFDLSKISSILQQAGYIDRTETTSWKLASVRTPTICIQAAISIVPAPSKEIQFISFTHRPLSMSTSTALFLDEINTVFEHSSFGASEEDFDLSEDERNHRSRDRRFPIGKHTHRQLNGRNKGVDKWPMFCVRIDLQDKQAGTDLEAFRSEPGSTEKWIEKIRGLLNSLFHEFLFAHHFRPQIRKRRRIDGISLNRNATAHPASERHGQVESLIRSLPLRVVSEPGPTPAHFHGWSRVKIGTSATGPKPLQYAFAAQIPGQLNSREHVLQQPQTSTERLQLAQNALSEVKLQALDDQDLEALVAEHDESETDADAEELEEGLSTSNEPSPEADEVIYLWTNPATGIEHTINARNGHIVPQKTLTAQRLSMIMHADGLGQSVPTPPDTALAQRVKHKLAKKTPAELIASIQQSDLIRSFRPSEERIPFAVPDELSSVNCASAGEKCDHQHRKTSEYFSSSSHSTSHNLSKADLASANVLAQVDLKFILVQTGPSNGSDPLLVLIDQHAADERVKVEELYTQLCPGTSITMSKPIIFEVAKRELQLFQNQKEYFAAWQIIYEVDDASKHVVVRALSSLIAERCRLHPKLLIDFMRRQVHVPTTGSITMELGGLDGTSTTTNWIHRMPSCPAGLVEMVHSRACRSAIMFNDVLDKSKCEELVRRLAECVLPFQCAHGRPSCVVLPGWPRKDPEESREGSEFAAKLNMWKE